MRDIVTVLLGPAGIWFGWWLNQHSTRTFSDRAEQRAAEREERECVLNAVRLARQVGSGTRDVLHGMYLKKTGSSPTGLNDMLDEFNSRRSQFRDAVLSLRVLGPSWAVASAEPVDLLASRLSELAFLMQQGLTNEHMKSVNSEIPRLDRLVNEFVAEVSRRYNTTADELPPAPDYEAEGRWQPLPE